MTEAYKRGLIAWAHKNAPGEPAEVIEELLTMGYGEEHPVLFYEREIRRIFDRATENDPRCRCGHSIWFHESARPKQCSIWQCKCGYFEAA